MEITPTDNYKYLGEIINNKMNLKQHIKTIKGKAEASLQTILAIGGDRHLKEIEMECIWTLVESCIISIITNGAETWTTTKKENEEINRILDNIIKRILRVPLSTPREALYIETGLLDTEHHIIKKRLGMMARVEKNKK